MKRGFPVLVYTVQVCTCCDYGLQLHTCMYYIVSTVIRDLPAFSSLHIAKVSSAYTVNLKKLLVYDYMTLSPKYAGTRCLEGFCSGNIVSGSLSFYLVYQTQHTKTSKNNSDHVTATANSLRTNQDTSGTLL